MSNNPVFNLRPNEKLSVLIVDDEADIRETIRMFLEMMEIFTFIVEASNGAEALQKTQIQKFDLIITDLVMPKMTGADFVKNYRTYEHRIRCAKETPIVILSANVTNQELKKAIEFGVKNILTKPCEANQFMNQIQSVLLKKYKEKFIFKKAQSA